MISRDKSSLVSLNHSAVLAVHIFFGFKYGNNPLLAAKAVHPLTLRFLLAPCPDFFFFPEPALVRRWCLIQRYTSWKVKFQIQFYFFMIQFYFFISQLKVYLIQITNSSCLSSFFLSLPLLFMSLSRVSILLLIMSLSSVSFLCLIPIFSFLVSLCSGFLVYPF